MTEVTDNSKTLNNVEGDCGSAIKGLQAQLRTVKAENAKLREVEKYARILIEGSYRPEFKYFAKQYDDLKQALQDALKQGEE